MTAQKTKRTLGKACASFVIDGFVVATLLDTFVGFGAFFQFSLAFIGAN